MHFLNFQQYLLLIHESNKLSFNIRFFFFLNERPSSDSAMPVICICDHAILRDYGFDILSYDLDTNNGIRASTNAANYVS